MIAVAAAHTALPKRAGLQGFARTMAECRAYQSAARPRPPNALRKVRSPTGEHWCRKFRTQLTAGNPLLADRSMAWVAVTIRHPSARPRLCPDAVRSSGGLEELRPCAAARTALIRPARPAAASVWPMLVFDGTDQQRLLAAIAHAPKTAPSAANSTGSPALVPVPWAST